MKSDNVVFDRWLDHFLPKALREDPDATRRGRILVGTALSLAPLVAIGLGGRLLIAPLAPGLILLGGAAFLGLLVAPWVLKGHGSLTLAGALVVSSLLLIIVVTGFIAHGITAPVLVVAPVIPLSATLLLGSRAGFWVVCVVLPFLGLFTLLRLGDFWQQPPALSGRAEIVAQGLMLSLAVLMVAVFASLSEHHRIRAEQRFSRTKTLYRRLFEQSKHIVAVSTPEGRLIDINQAGLDFYGVDSKEALLARNITDAYADSAQRRQLLAQLETDGFVQSYTTVQRTATGGLRTVEGTTTTIRREDATVEYLLAILTDVTEKQRTDADRETLVAELAAKNAELERFTGAVSHDLKGPLTTIRGYAGLIQHAIRQNQPDQVLAFSGELDQGIERMARMIDDLLRLSQIGSRAIQRKEIDARQVALEAIGLLNGQITATGSRVEVAPDLPPVTGDPALTRIIFQNLIENAIKFSAHQPLPTVNIDHRSTGPQEPRHPTATFTVTDNGRGVEPQDRERIFGLFERLHEDNDGSGIGLASVQQAVELQGGTVWVESNGAEKGSTFCFTLPLQMEPA